MALSDSSPVAVWDFPTRLFHWLLVILLAFSWWSAENHAMDWHRLSGAILLGLVIFRLIWGVIGGSTARFANFVKSPGAVMRYWRRPAGSPAAPGHNPLGAYSVLVMLLLLVVQLGTGLFAVDVDGLESGYLSHLVSFDEGRTAAEVHEISFTLLQIVVALHVLAVLFYLVFRRRNLVGPMVTGRDRQLEGTEGALTGAGPVRFLVAAVLAAALAWWTTKGLGL